MNTARNFKVGMSFNLSLIKSSILLLSILFTDRKSQVQLEIRQVKTMPLIEKNCAELPRSFPHFGLCETAVMQSCQSLNLWFSKEKSSICRGLKIAKKNHCDRDILEFWSLQLCSNISPCGDFPYWSETCSVYIIITLITCEWLCERNISKHVSL